EAAPMGSQDVLDALGAAASDVGDLSVRGCWQSKEDERAAIAFADVDAVTAPVALPAMPAAVAVCFCQRAISSTKIGTAPSTGLRQWDHASTRPMPPVPH